MKTYKAVVKVTYAKDVWVIVDDNQNEWDARKEAYKKVQECIDPEVLAPELDIIELEGGEHDEVMTECYNLIEEHFKTKEKTPDENS